jgi:Na+/glutamate symporter
VELEQSAESADSPGAKVPPTWVVAPAQISERLGGQAPGSRILALGLASLVFGAVMGHVTGTICASRLFVDVESVRQRLSIPVVAEIAPTDAATRRLARRHRLVRGVTTACELTLACFVFACILVAFDVSRPVLQFGEDPFGVLSEVVMRVARQ